MKFSFLFLIFLIACGKETAKTPVKISVTRIHQELEIDPNSQMIIYAKNKDLNLIHSVALSDSKTSFNMELPNASGWEFEMIKITSTGIECAKNPPVSLHGASINVTLSPTTDNCQNQNWMLVYCDTKSPSGTLDVGCTFRETANYSVRVGFPTIEEKTGIFSITNTELSTGIGSCFNLTKSSTYNSPVFPIPKNSVPMEIELYNGIDCEGTKIKALIAMKGRNAELENTMDTFAPLLKVPSVVSDPFLLFVQTTNLLLPVPSNPTTLTKTVDTKSQITLTWPSVNGASGYLIAYGNPNAPSTCTLGINQVNTNSKMVTGLAADTVYEFRVCSINENPIPDISNGIIISGKTLKNIPPAPTQFLVSSASATTISFTWNSGGADTAGYKLAYQAGSTAPSCIPTNINFISGISSHTVTGLSPATVYSFKLCAVNDNPTPDLSVGVDITETTLQTAPPDPISPSVTINAFDNVTLNWTSGGGSTSSFIISYTSGGTSPAVKCTSGTPINENSTTKTIAGLSSNTVYKFRICAVNSNATPEVSDGVVTTSITTPNAPPYDMGFSQNRFDDADNTKVLLSWDTPGSGTSVQNYKLTYAVGTQPPIDCTSPNFTLTNITLSKTVTGLNPSLDYAFRLCAFNSTALPTTSTGSVAIVYAIPSNPISLQSEVKSNAKVKLTWDHGTIPGSWYKVAWAAGSAPANCDSGTAASGFTSHTVTGLDPSTTYGFLVCAYNSNQTYNFSSGTTVNGTTDSSDFHFLPGKFGFKKNPQVLINNLPSTHQVKLYLDENCTGTDLLNDAGTGVGMTSHTFTPSYASPLGVGTHMFYYKVLNSIPSWSTCLEGDEYTVKGPPDIYLHQDGHYHLSWINRDNENVVNSGYHLYVVENGGTPSLLGNYTLTQDLQLTGWNPGSQYKYFISTEFPGSVFVNSDYSNIVTAPGLFSVTPLSVNFAAGIDMTSAVDGKGVIDYFDFNIAPAYFGRTNFYIGHGCSAFHSYHLVDGQTDSWHIFASPGVNDYSIEVINSVDTSSCIDFSYDFYPCASGYIPIEANLNRGTDYSFCVMSFEAKKVSNTATSQSSGTPWVNVNKTEAMTECSNLSPAGHHLITNEEWMTVAELAESYWGWGDPALPQGVFNHNQAEAVNTSLMYAPFPDVDFDPVPKTHRRKLFLPLGGEIWDLSGNVREWIDGSLPTCASSSSLSVNDYIDMNNTCSNWDTTPLRKLFRPSGNHNNNYNTVGSYNTTHLAAHAIVRGGGFQSDQFNTGIYHIDANVNPANGYSDVGFRCVFKP